MLLRKLRKTLGDERKAKEKRQIYGDDVAVLTENCVPRVVYSQQKRTHSEIWPRRIFNRGINQVLA